MSILSRSYLTDFSDYKDTTLHQYGPRDMDNMGTRFDFTSKRCDYLGIISYVLLLFMDNTSAAGRAGWYTWISLGGYSPAFTPDGMPRGRFAWFRTCWDCFWRAAVKDQLSRWPGQAPFTAQLHHLFRFILLCPGRHQMWSRTNGRVVAVTSGM